jgi:hypothetical protein
MKLRGSIALPVALLVFGISKANATVVVNTVDFDPTGAIAGASYTDFG